MVELDHDYLLSDRANRIDNGLEPAGSIRQSLKQLEQISVIMIHRSKGSDHTCHHVTTVHREKKNHQTISKTRSKLCLDPLK